MYVEKNVFDNIIHIMVNSDWTNDNEKAMMDLEEYCRRPELNLEPLREKDGHQCKPKTNYTLTFVQS